jgi:hypothetical protein
MKPLILISFVMAIAAALLSQAGEGPALDRAAREALIAAANQAVRQHMQSAPQERHGVEIAKAFWGPPIASLKPLRVRDDLCNVFIVLTEDATTETGLYVSNPISSYAPGHDQRWLLCEKLTQPGDRAFGELFRCKIRKDAPNALPDAAPPALPEADQGIAARYPGDQGIAADPAVLFHDDFEADDLRKKWDNSFHDADIRIATEPANVHGGKRALEFTVPKQPEELSNGVVKEFKAGQDVVFLRYYSKFEQGFDQVGSSHNGGLLSALAPEVPYATPGIRADGRNKFIASFENWRGESATPSPGGLNVYCYHPEQRSVWGDHFYPLGQVMPDTSRAGNFGAHFIARPDFISQLDRWYCFELMLKANSAGRRDGRIACWVDGRLIADFPNLRLRDVDTLKINSAALNLHIRNNTIRANKKWYDDLVVATAYIGPVAGKK